MGNEVVIPSMGNWYSDYLHYFGITVKKFNESGTFALNLDCIDKKRNPVIVKAFQSNAPLKQMSLIGSCEIYFNILKDSMNKIDNIGVYNAIHVVDNCAFLIRPKYEFTLSQRIEEYPPLESIEKLWISFKIISAVNSLHEINLIHGSINPHNVFVSLDLEVKISDLSPFKPSHIKEDKPQLFHHYFTTASEGYCYLSPDQIIDSNKQIESAIFGLGTFPMDLFSTGLVLYYLFTESHLFTFSQLIQYRKSQIDITEKLEKVPTEIRPFIKSLLSLDPDERITVFKKYHEYFPPSFSQLSEQSSQFFSGEVELKHIISLIPSFELLFENLPTESRLLFLGIFLRYLSNSSKVQETVYFMNFIYDYSLPLNDIFKLNRVLPHFCSLLKTPSDIVKSNSLTCIYKIICSLKNIPDGFQIIFQKYVIPIICKAVNNQSIGFRTTTANVCPLMTISMYKLQSDIIQYAFEMLNFIKNETEVIVIKGFIHSMYLIIDKLNYESFIYFHKLMFSCLTSENNVKLKIGIFRIYRIYYENSNEKHLLRQLYKDIPTIILTLIKEEKIEKNIISYLSNILWLLEQNLFPKTLTPELYFLILEFKETINSPNFKYYTTKIFRLLPNFFEYENLSLFIHDLLEPQQYHKNIIKSIEKKKFETESLMTHIGITISPRFISSYKISDYPISIMSPIYEENLFGIMSDTKGNVYLAPRNKRSYLFIEEENGVSAITQIRNTNSIAIANEIGKLSLIDLNTKQRTETNINFESPVTNIISTDPNILYGISKKGKMIIFDKRDYNIQNTITFGNNLFSTSSFCTWRNNVLLGVGFNEGLVTIFDTRIMLPISNIYTPSVLSLAPVNRNQCNFIVATPDNVICYDTEANHPEFVFNMKNSFVLPYDGNGVIINDLNVVYVDCMDFQNSLLLFDGELKKNLMINNDDNDNDEINLNIESLHKHIYPIKCANHINEIFMTGDENGFAHFWCVSDFA